MSKNIAIIFAGGSGARMGSGMPKQFLEVAGKPIIIHTLELFEEHDMIDKIYIACKKEYIKHLRRLIEKNLIRKVAGVVPGGSTGQDSIYKALKMAYDENDGDDIVLIHDGVRPHITSAVISEDIECVRQNGSAITCTPLFETPVISSDGKTIDDVPSRDGFFTAQAPQCFYLKDVIEAHEQMRQINPNYEGIIDTCTLMKKLGHDVVMVQGNRGNVKVTTPEDLYIFHGLVQYHEVEQIFGFGEKEVVSRLKK